MKVTIAVMINAHNKKGLNLISLQWNVRTFANKEKNMSSKIKTANPSANKETNITSILLSANPSVKKIRSTT